MYTSLNPIVERINNRDHFSFPEPFDLNNFTEIIQFRSCMTPDQTAIEFYHGPNKLEKISYQKLWQKICAYSTYFSQVTQPGDRALILLPMGPEYYYILLALMHRGCIPIPLYPPINPSAAGYISRVIANAEPAIIVTDRKIYTVFKNAKLLSYIPLVGRFVKNFYSEHNDTILSSRSKWILLESFIRSTAPSSLLAATPCRDQEIAFLMYTSGSTNDPKGVIVKHKSLMANIIQIASTAHFTRDSRGINWLPPYHDMGLVGCLCMALLLGFPTSLFSPLMFLKDPLAWLEKIHASSGPVSIGCPNFAYDLLVKLYDPKRCASLDLSNVTTAINGAEPIRIKTLSSFIATYGKHGFRDDAFLPCYGLAEGTLYVTGAYYNSENNKVVCKQSLQIHRVKPADSEAHAHLLVSSGKLDGFVDVQIVHPDSAQVCEQEEIGEIVISGVNCTPGYWNNPVDTGKLWLEIDGKRYLKTGDLGFISNRHLYVCGRLKDLIIIKGKNYYPQDIELLLEEINGIRKGCVAAVAIETSDGSEGLGVIAEVYSRDPAELEALATKVLEKISQAFQLRVHELAFVAPKKIIKTSSGKIKRYKNRDHYLVQKKDYLYLKS